MRRSIILFLFLFLPFVVSSQSNIRLRVDHSGVVQDSTSMAEVFSQYDFSDVPTGFLLEAGFPYFDLTRLNKDDRSFVDIHVLYSIVESIKSADVSGTRTWSDNPFSGMNSSRETLCPLWITAYNYNSFSSKASQYVRFSHGRFVKDSSALPSDLYDGHTVVAFAPAYSTVTRGAVNFGFRFTENSNIVISDLLFDAGDGLGFRRVSVGESVSVNYQDTGVKDISLVVLTPSCSYQTRSRVIVNDSSLSKRHTSIVPDESKIFRETYGEQIVKAKLSVWHCLDTTVHHQTLIIVEGYDPVDLLNLSGSYGEEGIRTIDSFEKDINAYGLQNRFDICYIDWFNSEADIRANASLLENILQDINRRKHLAGNDEKNVIIAQSMGGLITQYALRSMELAGKPHETTHCFSHDVPYHGAVIPPGFVSAFQSLTSYYDQTRLYKVDSTLHDLYTRAKDAVNKYLYSSSAKQMIVNYITPDGRVDHAEFDKLQKELQGMGLPSGDPGSTMVNIAVSNGGSPGLLIDSLAVRNNKMLDFSASVTPTALTALASLFLGGFSNLVLSAVFNPTGDDFWGVVLSCIPGGSYYDFTMTISPYTSPGQSVSHFYAVYHVSFLGIHFQRTFFDKEFFLSDTPALDLSYGSYFEIEADTDNPMGKVNPLVDILLSPVIHLSVAPRVQLVPLYSSLRHKEGKAAIDRDYYNNPLYYKQTEFDSYFLPDTAQTHISEGILWRHFLDQVDLCVDCPDTMRVGDYLRLSDNTFDVAWDYPRNLMSVSSDSGRITNIFVETDVTVTGFYYGPGSFVSRKKRIHITPKDHPAVFLEPHFYGDTLAIEAHSSNPYYDAKLQTDAVSRTWFYKRDLDPLEESYKHPVKFTMLGCTENSFPFRYKLTVAVHITDYDAGLYDYFADYSIWNNQRVHLVQPTAIIICRDGLFITSSVFPGYRPLLAEPLVVGVDSHENGDYTDRLLSEDVLFLNSNGDQFPCRLSENFWILPSFFRDPSNMGILEDIFESMNDGDMGVFELRISASLKGDPFQTFLIPVLRKDSLAI